MSVDYKVRQIYNQVIHEVTETPDAWKSVLRLAGQIYVQLPHSIHSIPLIFSKVSQSRFIAAFIIMTGTIWLGQTLTQRPQRIHAVGSKAATWSFVKQVKAEEVLHTGTSTVNRACPIIGPPEMIFSGSVLKPPAASISSW